MPVKTSTVPTRLPMWLTLSIILVVAVLLAPTGFAQDAAEAADAAEEAPTTFLQDLLNAGWAMIPLALLSIFWLTLLVFNSLQLAKGKFVPRGLRVQLMDMMSQVRVRSAIEASAASPSFLGRMMASSLPNVDATDPETLGRAHVEDAMADFTAREQASYMAWVQFFSVIAQAAPMVGLLGTVSGMISAFKVLGIGGGSNAGKLAAAISEALWTTATGLVIAIPALICYYIFKNKLSNMIGQAHKTAGDAMDAAIATVNADQQMAKVPEGLAEE